MKTDTFFIFLGVFVVLVILLFIYKWLAKRKDISHKDLTTEIEDFSYSEEKPVVPEKQELILGELDLLIRDKEISSTKISDEEIVIGRDPTHSTIIISEPTVSKLHCRIFSKGNSLFIKDNDSTNGTFVNNKKITETEIKSNDMKFLGKKGTIKLVFRRTNE